MSKKIFTTIIILSLMLTLCIGGFAQAKNDDSYDFIFVGKVVHPWYEVVVDGAEQAVKEFAERGIEINVKFNAPSSATVTQYVNTLESSIASNPDAMAISCLDESAVIPLIKESLNRGIPTITFDTDAPNSDRIMFVGQTSDEDHRMGMICAEMLAEELDGEGKVGILIGSPTAPGHRARTAGFKEKLEEYPEMEVVCELADKDSVEQAISLTSQAIKAHPDIDAFYGTNASNPFGAAKAIDAAGKADEIVVVGTSDLPDTIRYMRKGIVIGTGCLDQWEMGYWSVYYMWALNNNHTVPAPLHETKALIVTPDNLDDFDAYDAPEYQID